ncbi:SH3 domain-containing protein [Leptolyngbya sp. FACHB-671]|nr:SH3 domain-containing protein [Leptolyngbya sp. FACHB-671]
MGQAGFLTASDPGSRINLRSEPNPNVPTQRYGLVGDQVLIQESTSGSDGYTWYRVRFTESGAVGWIRSTFVSTEEEY